MGHTPETAENKKAIEKETDADSKDLLFYKKTYMHSFLALFLKMIQD